MMHRGSKYNRPVWNIEFSPQASLFCLHLIFNTAVKQKKWVLWLGRIRFILKLLKENINCRKLTLKKILPFTNFMGLFGWLVEFKVLFV